MPSHPISKPQANAPADRLQLAVSEARGAAPAAAWCGCTGPFCCACAADDAEPSYAVTPGTPCGCFHEE